MGRKPQSSKSTAWWMVLGAIAFSALGVWQYQKTGEFMKTAVMTTGTVISVSEDQVKSKREDGNYDYEKRFNITVEYKDKDGKIYTEDYTNSTNIIGNEGSKVDVLYDPANPSEMMLKESGGPQKTSWIFLGIGAVCLIASFVYFAKA
jgi:hypothetical protein